MAKKQKQDLEDLRKQYKALEKEAANATNDVLNAQLDLNKAKEIHVMESAFKSMVEHFPTEGKLVFHNNREHPLGKTKKDWEVIEYVS